MNINHHHQSVDSSVCGQSWIAKILTNIGSRQISAYSSITIICICSQLCYVCQFPMLHSVFTVFHVAFSFHSVTCNIQYPQCDLTKLDSRRICTWAQCQSLCCPRISQGLSYITYRGVLPYIHFAAISGSVSQNIAKVLASCSTYAWV